MFNKNSDFYINDKISNKVIKIYKSYSTIITVFKYFSKKKCIYVQRAFVIVYDAKQSE